MNKRILIAGSCDMSLKEVLKVHFDVWESRDIEDTRLVLINQYHLIKVVLISIELFHKDNYHIINEIRKADILKHIPVICIGPIYEDISKQTLDYHDALDHGALDFYAAPLDIPAIQKYISNIIDLKADSYYAMNVESDLMNQMQMIIRSMNCGITVAYDDFGEMKYEYANELFYSIFGYTENEFKEDEINVIQDLILPEYLFEVKTGLNNARTQRRPIILVFQARKKEGTVIWVKIRCSVYFMKARGKSEFITTYEDITNTKASEDRLLLLNEKLANSEVYIQLDLINHVVEEYHSDFEPENDNLPIQYRNYKELLLSHICENEKENTWEVLSFENLLKSYNKGNTKLVLFN